MQPVEKPITEPDSNLSNDSVSSKFGAMVVVKRTADEMDMIESLRELFKEHPELMGSDFDLIMDPKSILNNPKGAIKAWASFNFNFPLAKLVNLIKEGREGFPNVLDYLDRDLKITYGDWVKLNDGDTIGGQTKEQLFNIYVGVQYDLIKERINNILGGDRLWKFIPLKTKKLLFISSILDSKKTDSFISLYENKEYSFLDLHANVEQLITGAYDDLEQDKMVRIAESDKSKNSTVTDRVEEVVNESEQVLGKLLNENAVDLSDSIHPDDIIVKHYSEIIVEPMVAKLMKWHRNNDSLFSDKGFLNKFKKLTGVDYATVKNDDDLLKGAFTVYCTERYEQFFDKHFKGTNIEEYVTGLDYEAQGLIYTKMLSVKDRNGMIDYLKYAEKEKVAYDDCIKLYNVYSTMSQNFNLIDKQMFKSITGKVPSSKRKSDLFKYADHFYNDNKDELQRVNSLDYGYISYFSLIEQSYNIIMSDIAYKINNGTDVTQSEMEKATVHSMIYSYLLDPTNKQKSEALNLLLIAKGSEYIAEILDLNGLTNADSSWVNEVTSNLKLVPYVEHNEIVINDVLKNEFDAFLNNYLFSWGSGYVASIAYAYDEVMFLKVPAQTYMGKYVPYNRTRYDVTMNNDCYDFVLNSLSTYKAERKKINKKGLKGYNYEEEKYSLPKFMWWTDAKGVYRPNPSDQLIDEIKFLNADGSVDFEDGLVDGDVIKIRTTVGRDHWGIYFQGKVYHYGNGVKASNGVLHLSSDTIEAFCAGHLETHNRPSSEKLRIFVMSHESLIKRGLVVSDVDYLYVYSDE